MAASKPHAIIALDLLRFASALLVVAFHYGAAFALAPSAAAAALLHALPVTAPLARASWFGWIGVELFFMISGFVIALSAEGIGIATFLRRRALRLLPAAWICATVTLGVVAVTLPAHDLPLRWLRSVTFWPGDGGWIDPSYWTLPIEICFYLLIATGLGTGGTLAAIEQRARWLGLASVAFWIVVLCTGWTASPLLQYQSAPLLLARYGCIFALGVTILALLRDHTTRLRLGLLSLFAATALLEIAAHAIERATTLRIAATPLVPMLVFIAGLVVMLASLKLQPLLQRYIGTRIASRVGLMTYPLYLIHQDVGAAAAAALMRGGLPFAPAILLTLVGALAFAYWVASVAEPALRRPLARLFSPRHAPARDRFPNASLPGG
ncbi:MAG: acyltransferase family protein [Pseudomonadota bacterium]|jgi:peptidoglycan/LPS O-acetylase OafA/YrhL